jgi:hypothetical protein
VLRLGLAFVICAFAATSASAQICRLKGPRPLLAHDTVSWTLTVPADTVCLHGVRSASLILDRVMMAQKPRSGEATVKGYGLTYRPNPGFKGEDTLSLVFLGSTAKIRNGTSTIEIAITVE